MTAKAAEGLKTTAPVEPADLSNAQPEFGRLRDVKRLYGLPRGTTYNLLKLGRIRGVNLRVTGRKSGCRLIDLQSVRDYIRQCQEAA
jgi:hypothetical protein